MASPLHVTTYILSVLMLLAVGWENITHHKINSYKLLEKFTFYGLFLTVFLFPRTVPDP